MAIAASASAQTAVKIGVLADMSGLYSDIGGQGAVEAVQMAVEDFAATDKTLKIDIVSADVQNKPDIAAAIARRWFDTENVDVLVDVPTSATSLAVATVTRDKNKV
ncbi:ABC transporter substrate-binding protein, partial [Klebsiella pneumoniae]|uniref:ABC transporter substrate-binding protein n=1 Tax=Klebsiella pneumoniae TaxID=573 RepID=UPI003715ACE0